MRTGVLGGSFNPIHRGHLAVARAVRDAAGLDRVLLVPCAHPPHKREGGPDLAPAEDRLAMVRLAVKGERGLEASDAELRRDGPSYTVDTIAALRRDLPQDELFLVVGADALADLPHWHDAPRLVASVPILAVNRPGHELALGTVTAIPGCDVRVLDIPPDSVSATEVRERLGRGESIDGFVPQAVLDYIAARRLYGAHAGGASMTDTTTPSGTGFPVATVRSLDQHVGRPVELRGWLYKSRAKGKIAFVHLRDGTGIVQVIVAKGSVPDETFEAIKELGQESSLIVRGTVRKDERAPGGFEVDACAIDVVGKAVREYPISHQEHGIDFLLSNRHLWLRSRLQHAVMRVRNELAKAVRDFFYDKGFMLIDAPIFTPNACEGTTTLFEVTYFDEKAYLTQSGQLYMEAAAMAHGNVYCFGPTFRAERSKTRRHLTEFWMVEPEMAYAGLDQVMDLAEEFVSYLVARALDRCAEELKVLERDPKPLEAVRRPFPRISYTEAVALLKAKGHPFEWGGDLGAPDETVISQSFDRPVMIHRYPAEVKAFYMRKDPADPKVALCVDMIAPEGVGEIIGGGERSIDLVYLEQQIEKHGLPKQAFEWYLDLRRYGTVPHAGFGLGLERTIAWICGREHVREAIPFPRTIYRKDP